MAIQLSDDDLFQLILARAHSVVSLIESEEKADPTLIRTLLNEMQKFAGELPDEETKPVRNTRSRARRNDKGDQ